MGGKAHLDDRAGLAACSAGQTIITGILSLNFNQAFYGSARHRDPTARAP